jgi:uncharacterized protein (DUF58 family)
MVVPVLWALLAALVLVLSWTTRSGAFAWVGYLMLTAWAVGYAMGRLAERGLGAVRRVSTDRIPFGGQAIVEVTVRNSSRLPVIWLSGSETLPAGLPMTGVRGRVGPLGGRGQFTFQFALHGARRGWYEIGPTHLRTGDLFGLVQRERTASGTSGLIVFPRIVPIEHVRLPSRRPVGDLRTRQRVLEDPTQVVGVRPYQHGDGLRRVHWRATAHTGRLQSKLFEIAAQLETTIVVNLRRQDYPDSAGDAEEAAELAISAAASIAQHVLERRERVALLALGRDPMGDGAGGLVRVRAGRGRPQLTAILSVLGRMELGPAAEASFTLEDEKDDLAWGSLVVLVTPALGKADVSSALRLRAAGFEVRSVLVGRDAQPASEVAALPALGVRASRVLREADIRALNF